MTAATILVIDDASDMRELLSVMLGRAGYEVAVASNGKQGLTDFERLSPDAVLLDVGMPGMDGWEVLRRIRAQSDVPVLMLTGMDASTDRRRGMGGAQPDFS